MTIEAWERAGEIAKEIKQQQHKLTVVMEGKIQANKNNFICDVANIVSPKEFETIREMMVNAVQRKIDKLKAELAEL